MNIYIGDISQMMDLSGSMLLTEERRERMQRYIQLPDRARCLTAGLMLRAVFGSDQAQRIITTPLGKPYLPDGQCFNISHSGDKVVLLVADCDAGVDVEQICPYPRAVARRVFTSVEQEWLQNQKNDAAFYRLWTGKESIMKALGVGFRLAPESFEILPEESGPNPVMGRSWFLQWQQLDGHMLCCASCVPDEKVKLIFLSKKELLT